MGRDLLISYNIALTSVDLSSLTSVGEDLFISENASLTALDLSSLTSVGDALGIFLNPLFCQSLVDAVVAACPSGCLGINNNDDGC